MPQANARDARWSRFPLFRSALLSAVVVLASCTDATQPVDDPSGAAQAAKGPAQIDVASPTEGATVQGQLLLQARVSGMGAGRYSMYWQVDGREPQAMDALSATGEYKQATTDVSGWTWRGEGPYVVRFFATDRKGGRIAERSVSVYVGAAASVATVRVSPAQATVTVGGTTRLVAEALDATGATLAGRPVQWTSSNASIAGIAVDGTVLGVAAGTAVMTATIDGVSGSASIEVQPATTSSPTNPFAGASFYVDPYSNARKTADAWKSTRPADAEQMEKVARNSWASWYNGWSADVRTAVSNRVTTVTAAGALPVLVAYNIPQRDCGSYSAGGVGSPEAYRTWIREFAAGIGSRRAAVILEPDALAGMGCLSAADQDTRLALLKDAVQVLKSLSGVAVYIDAGHSNWLTVSTAVSRLGRAGIELADGFSLNVSNFQTTAASMAYGEQISQLVGGKHFVIDTSRNGLGSNGEWCNPSGRALGTPSTGATGHPLVDALLWIKVPGESDGTCNGGPNSGAWWAEYALGLAERSTISAYYASN